MLLVFFDDDLKIETIYEYVLFVKTKLGKPSLRTFQSDLCDRNEYSF